MEDYLLPSESDAVSQAEQMILMCDKAERLKIHVKSMSASRYSTSASLPSRAELVALELAASCVCPLPLG